MVRGLKSLPQSLSKLPISIRHPVPPAAFQVELIKHQRERNASVARYTFSRVRSRTQGPLEKVYLARWNL